MDLIPKHNYFNKYGETKSQAEKIYEKWLDEDKFNRNLTIIRPTVIFGPGNRGNVYNLISSIAKNKFNNPTSINTSENNLILDNISLLLVLTIKKKYQKLSYNQ